jgi:effector-binding domain-containing protein
MRCACFLVFYNNTFLTFPKKSNNSKGNIKHILMHKLLLLLTTILIIHVAPAQTNESAMVTKSFLIIASTKNYTQAKTQAVAAAKKLHITLNLRGLQPHKTNGLTFAKNICDGDGFDYPCYVSRGRELDATYISIEWSNAFNSFAKGYYVVIAHCGNKTTTNAALKKIKKYYATAYAKQDEVYLGCMH